MALLGSHENARRRAAPGDAGPVLIISHHKDKSAIAVKIALDRLGAESCFIPIDLFPFHGEHSFEITQDACRFREDPSGFSTDQALASVWYRRRAPSRAFDYARPWTDEDFRRRSLAAYALSLYEFLQIRYKSARWVNSPWAASRANSKMAQLRLAPRCGLTIPRTLISNAPDEIRAFLSRHRGEIVLKSLIPYTVTNEGLTKYIMTVKVPADAVLDDEHLSGQMSIYQVYARKQYEVRLLIFGDHAYALKIRSAKKGEETVDWRTLSPSKEHFSPIEAPAEVVTACRRLMDQLGIAFGCFDFVVSPQGDYVFLEVNESGDFLWMEECAPDFPILADFAAWLAGRGHSAVTRGLGVLNIVSSPQFRALKSDLDKCGKKQPDHEVKLPF